VNQARNHALDFHANIRNMNTLPASPLRTHWFLVAAPLVIATDIYMALTQRGDAPRLIEAGLLFDLAILLPALCWWCYRSQGRKAVIRAVALACLGIWVVGKLVPAEAHVLLTYVAPLRYAGLAVLVWIELAIVVAIWRAVFKGKSVNDATAALPLAQDMPPWVARLIAWEARLWLRVWRWIRSLVGKD
jgi:cbb3-type cytochrome oxidase subunit 3